MKKSHLTLDDRIRIETLIAEKHSIRYIADRLDKSPSTISREIKKHAQVKKPKGCDCAFSRSCTLSRICGSTSCNKKCRECAKARKYCPDYSKAYCDTLQNSQLRLCNECRKRAFCHFEQRFYDGNSAHAKYRDTLIHSRDGFDLTAGQFSEINDIVSPAVKSGQSVYHIVQSNAERLHVSESTVRRLIRAGEMDADTIDLPEAVKRKPRKKKDAAYPAPRKSKLGHLYSDFLGYMAGHDLPVVEMDCVEGRKCDKEALLTLHFTPFHMQLVYILDRQDSACVVDMLDFIEKMLGKELFARCFPVILTDNGAEFSDIKGIERSVFGGKRTRVYFCEPNRSDEKGKCENNHKLVRRVVPKHTSVKNFMQADMLLLTKHLNSYVRKSLFGKCPFDMAMAVLPEDFFILLGLEKIPPAEVLLAPALLSK